MGTFDAKVPDWMVSHATLPGKCSGARGDDLCDGYALGEMVFGDVPGAQFAAFAYCWRRFGPPWLGSDPHKELAQYVLGTPNPGIFLTLGLSGSQLKYAVGYLITQSLRTTFAAPRRVWERKFEQWWMDTKATDQDRALVAAARLVPADKHAPAVQAVAERYWDDRLNHTLMLEAEATIGQPPSHHDDAGRMIVVAALLQALHELLRPVFVRDVAINILGRVQDDDLDDRESAPPSPYAGYGIDHDSMAYVFKEQEA